MGARRLLCTTAIAALTQHPIREINPFSVDDPALLGAFCDLFD